jgi:capsular polysaccharide biosynthesis protein/Mrp family chromosome partitioning ATPase
VEKRYLYMLKSWSWLLIVSTLVTGFIGYLMVKDRPPAYQAKAKLLVGPGIDAPNPDLGALRTGGQLMQTYAELIETTPFLQAVIDELGLNIGASELGRMIDVRTNQDTQIMIITVTHNEPVTAIAIANAAAEEMVARSPSADDSPTSILNAQMRGQAARLEQIIANSDATIEKLEADLTALAETEGQGLIVLQTEDYLEKQRLIVEQLSAERGQLSDALAALTQLYDSLKVAPTNQVKIVEPAVSSETVLAQPRLTMLMAAGAGLILALVVAFTFEFFSDSIKTGDELAKVTGLPILGTISSIQHLDHANPTRLILFDQPESRTAESYRMLGTKLLSRTRRYRKENGLPSGENQIFDEKQNLKSLLISSSQPEDDNRELASNLAVALEQAKHKVILVDAGLSDPTIHRHFELGDQTGLSDLLLDPNVDLGSTLVPCSKYLSILTSGSKFEDEVGRSFELLASDKMSELMREIEKEAEIIIVSAPPILSSANTLVLASYVDGVIIAAREGRTRRERVVDAVESLRELEVNIVGVVLDQNLPVSYSNLRGESVIERITQRLQFAAPIFKMLSEKKSSLGPSSAQTDPDDENTNSVLKEHSPIAVVEKKDRWKNEAFSIRTSKR